MIPFEDPTTLSLLYHLNSEPWLNTQAYNDRPTKWNIERSARRVQRKRFRRQRSRRCSS
jgi:hypothetical protein